MNRTTALVSVAITTLLITTALIVTHAALFAVFGMLFAGLLFFILIGASTV